MRLATVSAGSRAAAALLAIAGAWAGAGCASLSGLVQKPTAALDSVQLTQPGLDAATILFNVAIDNPNSFHINVNKLDYQLKLNGKDFTSGTLDQGLRIEANGKSTVAVPVRIKYLDLFNSLSEMINHGLSDYRLTGSAAVTPFSVPFDASGKIDFRKALDRLR